MAKKKLGKKHVCYQCGCKFYDLSRPKPICPKCGADQRRSPKKEPLSMPKGVAAAAVAPSPRARRRREEDDLLAPTAPFSEDEAEPAQPLEDGLSMIDDEELIAAGAEDLAEED
jgi:hypothetical protein